MRTLRAPLHGLCTLRRRDVGVARCMAQMRSLCLDVGFRLFAVACRCRASERVVECRVPGHGSSGARATRRIGSTHPATTWRTVPGVAGDVRMHSRKRGFDRRIALEGAIGAIASADHGRHPFLRGCRPAPFSTLRPWQAAAADAPTCRVVLTLRGTLCRFPLLICHNRCVAAESAGIGLCTTSRRRIGPPSYPAGTRRQHFLPRALSTACSVRSRMP